MMLQDKQQQKRVQNDRSNIKWVFKSVLRSLLLLQTILVFFSVELIYEMPPACLSSQLFRSIFRPRVES